VKTKLTKSFDYRKCSLVYADTLVGCINEAGIAQRVYMPLLLQSIMLVASVTVVARVGYTSSCYCPRAANLDIFRSSKHPSLLNIQEVFRVDIPRVSSMSNLMSGTNIQPYGLTSVY